jgi:uncharacterized protein (DUF1778 family)
MSVMRDERLQVRVDAVTKRRLEDAAAATGVSLSAFVVQAAQVQAAQVLADRAVLALSGEVADAFEAALARPGQVNEQLLAALKRPVKADWLD